MTDLLTAYVLFGAMLVLFLPIVAVGVVAHGFLPLWASVLVALVFGPGIVWTVLDYSAPHATRAAVKWLTGK